MDAEHGRLDDEAERETRLSLDELRIVGRVCVVPAGNSKPDTEMLGMRASMGHERSEEFEPENVYEERGRGYNVVSRHPDGRVRKIAVKARCDMTCLEFTDRPYA